MKNIENKKEVKALMNVKKVDIIKYLHIVIIIIGSIFVLFPCFHTTLWFDESYSVAIASHPINEIWTIGSHDVHPVLYYIMLHILGIFTNGSILSYRIFSAIPLIILGILGFTHIKKDFGEKVGLIFSFLILFMPVTFVYGGEIRMYTWGMFFITLTAMYAYRIYKSGVSKKNWIIFSIFSLSAAYTHYYGLIAAFVLNISLFLYFLINNVKQRNYEVKYIKYSINLKYSIISAIIQIILYIPWIGAFLSQYSSVSQGFWIKTINIVEMFDFQFTGNLDTRIYITKGISYIFSLIMCIYMIYLFSKHFKEVKPARIAIRTYFLIIILLALISIFTTILYARYLLIITGIFLFALAYVMSKDKSKIRIAIICILIVAMSTAINIDLIKTNYDESNSKPMEYIREDIKPDDIILIDNNGSGFVVAAQFRENKLYFWDRMNWNVEEAYKAYGKTIYNLDNLKDYKGRIWIIGAWKDGFAEEAMKNLGGDIDVLKSEYFGTKYREYQYVITLIERK